MMRRCLLVTLIGVLGLGGSRGMAEERSTMSPEASPATLQEALDQARSEFGDLSGVRIEVRDGRVEIGGEVADPAEFRRIEGAAQRHARIRNRVRITGEMLEPTVQAIREAMTVPGITVRAIRERIVLEGTAFSAAEAKRAVEIAKLYAPDALDLIEVRDRGRRPGQGRMIELSFHLMEIKQSALRELGISWAPGAMPQGGTGGSGAGLLGSIAGVGRELLGFVFQLVPKLRTIRERGEGRVLEHPTMLVKSGEEAKLFSGSEVPYYRGQDVQFKRVGVEIEAVPIETSRGIDIRLNATLSAPTADLRGAIDTHTLQTTAICPEGQSVVLANLVRGGDVKMRNRVPRELDTSSAIFSLFWSKDFQANRSEFVIFVTPRVVEAPPTAQASMEQWIATEMAMARDRAGSKTPRAAGDGASLKAEKANHRGPKRWR